MKMEKRVSSNQFAENKEKEEESKSFDVVDETDLNGISEATLFGDGPLPS